MAEEMECSTHDESVNDSKSINVSENYSREINILGDESENLEEKDSLSDEKLENPEYDSASASTSNLRREEFQFDYEGTLHDIELEIAKEIAQTPEETVQSRLQRLDEMCMECSDVLNDFFQHVFNELREASILRNWARVGELSEIFSNSEPFYKPLLMITKVVDGMKNIVRKHENRLSKLMVNKVIRTCNPLEEILDELMLSVPEL